MKKVIIYTIQLYRKYLSNMKLQCCRFYPTCSEYAITSIEKHGIAKGLIKSMLRLIRCNPFSKGGYDPA